MQLQIFLTCICLIFSLSSWRPVDKEKNECHRFTVVRANEEHISILSVDFCPPHSTNQFCFVNMQSVTIQRFHWAADLWSLILVYASDRFVSALDWSLISEPLDPLSPQSEGRAWMNWRAGGLRSVHSPFYYIYLWSNLLCIPRQQMFINHSIDTHFLGALNKKTTFSSIHSE